MTNWYRFSQNQNELKKIDDSLSSFGDRNVLNAKIKKLKGVASILLELTKGGYQDIQKSREILQSMLQDKTLSSFPTVTDFLKEAHKVSRDNYNKFSAACDAALQKVYTKIAKMVQQRKEFVDTTLPKKMKERFENGKK